MASFFSPYSHEFVRLAGGGGSTTRGLTGSADATATCGPDACRLRRTQRAYDVLLT